MNYGKLIERLSLVAKNNEYLLVTSNERVYLHAPYFGHEQTLKIINALNKYRELEFVIIDSNRIKEGVMFQVVIYKYN